MKNRKQKNQQTSSRFTTNHVLVVVLALLIGFQVFFSNRVATSGQRLSELEDQAIKLEEDNQKLLSQHVDQLSLQELTKKAEELGFVEPEEVINLNTDDSSLALR